MTLPGPDHWFLGNAVALTKWVQSIRTAPYHAWLAVVQPTAAELEMRKIARRSVVAVSDIARPIVHRHLISPSAAQAPLVPEMLDFVLGQALRPEHSGARASLCSWETLRNDWTIPLDGERLPIEEFDRLLARQPTLFRKIGSIPLFGSSANRKLAKTYISVDFPKSTPMGPSQLAELRYRFFCQHQLCHSHKRCIGLMDEGIVRKGHCHWGSRLHRFSLLRQWRRTSGIIPW